MFRALTGYAVHRGCLALARLPTEQPAETLLKHARTVVVLESVSNPDNLGGVFRNAAACGVDAVLLNRSCCSPFYRKAVRTSMGATLQVPFSWLEPWPDGLDALDEFGITLVALTPRQPGLTLDQFAGAIRPSRLALLVGNEGHGLSQAAESRAHTRVRIPIAPDVDSLNLAVACGIALSRLAVPASAIDQS
jgi:tRNA G18 (ribose-2'-O)-methylase SpoU